MRRTETGEGGDEIDVVVPFQRRGQRLALGGVFDDAEAIAEPLHRRAGDEDRRLERVGNLSPEPPGDRRQESLARLGSLGPGVQQHEAAGPVGVLGLARALAGLPEERRLLVTGYAGDRGLPAELGSRAIDLRGWHRLGQ